MTEPSPFVPPAPPLEETRSTAAPTAAPTLPPPTGAPIGIVVVPPPPRRRRWLIPVVVGGSLLLVAVMAGIAVGVSLLAQWVSDMPVTAAPDEREPDQLAPPEDLVEGEPGDPVASEPLDCVTCFAADDVARIDVPKAAYVRLGLPIDDRQPFEVPMFADQRDHVGWWEDDGGSPAACYFAYTQPPLLFEPELDTSAGSDTILYASSHSDADGVYWLAEASRVFAAGSTASAHMLELEAAVSGCPEYSLSGAGYAAEVTAAPAFDVPADVAAYGWVETAGFSRYYAADVQRGNVITRLSMFSNSQGPSEQQFRAFVEDYARALAALER